MSAPHVGIIYSTIDGNGNPQPSQLISKITTLDGDTYVLPRLASGHTGYVTGILTDVSFVTVNDIRYQWSCIVLGTYEDLGIDLYSSAPVQITEHDGDLTKTITLSSYDSDDNLISSETVIITIASPQSVFYTGVDCGKVIELNDSNIHTISSVGLDNTFSITFTAIGAPRVIAADVPIKGFESGPTTNTIVLRNDGDAVTIMYAPIAGRFQVIHKSLVEDPSQVGSYISTRVNEYRDELIQNDRSWVNLKAYTTIQHSPWTGSIVDHPAGCMYSLDYPKPGFKPKNSGLYLLQFNLRMSNDWIVGATLFVNVFIENQGGGGSTYRLIVPSIDPSDYYYVYTANLTVVLPMNAGSVKSIQISNWSEVPFLLLNGSTMTATWLSPI